MQFEKLENLPNYTEESYLGAKLALMTSFTFLGVNFGLIFLLWFFMVFDTLFGVAKAVTLTGWASVTRTRFIAGIFTKLAVLFIPLSLALVGALAGYNLNIFVLTCVYMVIANDAISCFTNILSIKKKRDYVNKDFVEMFINALRSTVYEAARNAIEKLKNSNACPPEDESENKPKEPFNH